MEHEAQYYLIAFNISQQCYYSLWWTVANDLEYLLSEGNRVVVSTNVEVLYALRKDQDPGFHQGLVKLDNVSSYDFGVFEGLIKKNRLFLDEARIVFDFMGRFDDFQNTITNERFVDLYDSAPIVSLRNRLHNGLFWGGTKQKYYMINAETKRLLFEMIEIFKYTITIV